MLTNLGFEDADVYILRRIPFARAGRLFIMLIVLQSRTPFAVVNHNNHYRPVVNDVFYPEPRESMRGQEHAKKAVAQGEFGPTRYKRAYLRIMSDWKSVAGL